jgi:predicted ester cyclase
MSLEENKVIANRWTEEIWNQANMAAIDELCTPHFTFNYAPPGMPPNRESYKKTVAMFHNAFHNMHLTNELVIAEGNNVAVRWSGRSTHKGEFMGVAPTGKEVTMTGNSLARIEAGKFVEEWTEMDMVGMMQQIGAIPPSA